MDNVELGVYLYGLILEDVKNLEGNLYNKFPEDYPISRREVFYVKNGTIGKNTLKILSNYFNLNIEISYNLKKD
jgi:hypothetical protein